MTADDFVNVLVAEMEADGTTAFVDQLLKDARAQIRGGKGTVGTLTSAALNGKSFAKQVTFNAAEMLDICRRAIRRYTLGEDDTEVSATRPDFREFQP
jgi:hypothetical protein